MSIALLLDNLLQPAVLFFLLGVLAALAKSDLELPQPVPKLLSLYLLMAIGFKGGVELGHEPLGIRTLLLLAGAVAMSAAAPVAGFAILRRFLDAPSAAAVAAAYGSISAVTFVTGAAFLDRAGVPYSGTMVAAMALMEAPAIFSAILLLRGTSPHTGPIEWRPLLREAGANGAVFILAGSLIIGILSGARGEADLAPFTNGIFRGVLALFLLDLGVVAARRFGDIRGRGLVLAGFGIAFPLASAAVALAFARLIGATPGDAFLLTILFASASYIAVPAAVRLAIPQANPGFYVTGPLAITFPLNVMLGIPLYYGAVRWLWG